MSTYQSHIFHDEFSFLYLHDRRHRHTQHLFSQHYCNRQVVSLKILITRLPLWRNWIVNECCCALPFQTRLYVSRRLPRMTYRCHTCFPFIEHNQFARRNAVCISSRRQLLRQDHADTLFLNHSYLAVQPFRQSHRRWQSRLDRLYGTFQLS